MSKGKNRIGFVTERTKYQGFDENGEINSEIEKVKVVGKRRSQDRFIMLYWREDVSIYEILTPTLLSMLTRLAFSSDFNTGRIGLTYKIRRDICSDLNISDNLLSRRLKELRTRGVIIKDRNDFYLNPEIVWVGENAVRDGAISKSVKPDHDTGRASSGITPNEEF